MSISDSFRSIRSGSVRMRTGNRGMGRSARYLATEDIPVPKLEEYGHRPFALPEREALSRWLEEPGWPRGTMNIYSLEGYLVAMLVFPLGLRASVWLPSIWNESAGWKIPLAIQAPERYGEFLELLIGFKRFMDVGLKASPPRFETVVAPSTRHDRPTALREQDWVRGFSTALNRCAHINVFNDTNVRAALYAIANHTIDSKRSNNRSNPAPMSIEHAVLLLAQARIARGTMDNFASESNTIKVRP